MEVSRSSSARIMGNTISNNTNNEATVAKVAHADMSANIINNNKHIMESW